MFWRRADGWGGGGVLLVHNGIHYVLRSALEEVLVRNVIHYVTVLLYHPSPPRAFIHGYLHYSRRGRRRPANHPPPPEYLLTQHSCKETSSPLLQTTTLHNSTRIHKTTNVPVVFMALILNGFEGSNIITRGIGRGGPWKSSLVPFQGPKKSPYSGPTPSNAPRNDVAPLKTITYRAIKRIGTLIVIVE